MTSDLPSPTQAFLPDGHVPPDIYARAKEACREASLLGPSIGQKDMLITLIAISIEAGANTRKSIIGAVRSAKGYPTSQIAVVLKQEAGPSPDRHRWFADAQGAYVLHPNALN